MVAQVDTQFHTREITAQKTKFDHIGASLALEFATEIWDLIISPPLADAYDVLKAAFTKRITASQQGKLQQLLDADELVAGKPTQLQCMMQQLIGDGASATDSTFFWELFLQHLQGHIRMVLALTLAIHVLLVLKGWQN